MEPLVSKLVSMRWLPRPASSDEHGIFVQSCSGFYIDHRTSVSIATENDKENHGGPRHHQADLSVKRVMAGYKVLLPPIQGHGVSALSIS